MRLLVYEPDIPGNLGNLVRSALAFYVDSVYIYDPRGLTLPSNHRAFLPRIIAISQGAWGRVNPIIFYQASGVEKFLAEYNGRKVATVCNDSSATWSYKLDCREDDLVIMGNEKEGLPQEVIDAADVRLTIPISKRMHSLNVTTAFAAVAYEYLRQSSIEHSKRKKGGSRP